MTANLVMTPHREEAEQKSQPGEPGAEHDTHRVQGQGGAAAPEPDGDGGHAAGSLEGTGATRPCREGPAAERLPLDGCTRSCRALSPVACQSKQMLRAGSNNYADNGAA